MLCVIKVNQTALHCCPACSWVVKTTDQDKRKVFVNICGSDKVPMAGGWTDGKVRVFLFMTHAQLMLAWQSSHGTLASLSGLDSIHARITLITP